MTGEKYRVLPVPNWRENAYIDLFYGALADIEGVDRDFETWPREQLAEDLSDLDAVHFHWPEQIWRNGESAATLKSLVDFRQLIRHIAKAERRILWTVHNLLPHEYIGMPDRMASRMLARRADLIICHDEATADRVRNELKPRAAPLVMPHGNYCGQFPGPADPQETREALGLDPKRPLMAMVGRLRNYKGFDKALTLLDREPGLQLLIAGNSHPNFDLAALEGEISRRADRIKLVTGYLTEQQLADYHAAADLILLPYRDITGSGALLTALSLGRAVVASDLPYFHSVLGEARSPAGHIFPAEPDALAAAVRELLAADPETREATALSRAKDFDWDKVTARIRPALLDVLSRSGRQR